MIFSVLFLKWWESNKHTPPSTQATSHSFLSVLFFFFPFSNLFPCTWSHAEMRTFYQDHPITLCKISKDYHTLIFFLLLLYGCFVKSNVYQKLNLSSFISKMILLLCSTILFHNCSFSKVKFFPQCYGKGRNGEMKSFYS